MRPVVVVIHPTQLAAKSVEKWQKSGSRNHVPQHILSHRFHQQKFASEVPIFSLGFRSSG
jgi:hypothetical protein